MSFNCDVWFSQEGSYDRLLKAMGKAPEEVWSEDDRIYFKSDLRPVFPRRFAAFGGQFL